MVQSASSPSVDPAEVAKFSRLAEEWWDPNGKMAVLHKFNPIRLAYIRDAACRKFNRSAKSLTCLQGLRVLDIGCGAGLLCEPLTRLGADCCRHRSVGAEHCSREDACRSRASHHRLSLHHC